MAVIEKRLANAFQIITRTDESRIEKEKRLKTDKYADERAQRLEWKKATETSDFVPALILAWHGDEMLEPEYRRKLEEKAYQREYFQDFNLPPGLRAIFTLFDSEYRNINKPETIATIIELANDIAKVPIFLAQGNAPNYARDLFIPSISGADEGKPMSQMFWASIFDLWKRHRRVFRKSSSSYGSSDESYWKEFHTRLGELFYNEKDRDDWYNHKDKRLKIKYHPNLLAKKTKLYNFMLVATQLAANTGYTVPNMVLGFDYSELAQTGGLHEGKEDVEATEARQSIRGGMFNTEGFLDKPLLELLPLRSKEDIRYLRAIAQSDPECQNLTEDPSKNYQAYLNCVVELSKKYNTQDIKDWLVRRNQQNTPLRRGTPMKPKTPGSKTVGFDITSQKKVTRKKRRFTRTSKPKKPKKPFKKSRKSH